MSGERPVLSVTSFGGFSIAVIDAENIGRPVKILSDSKGHSRKLWSLVEYLVFCGKDYATFDELIDLLWPNEGDVDNPIASLRLLVHRARAELDKLGAYKGSELILRRDGAYAWNRAIPVETDTELFERLSERTDADPQQRVEGLMGAAELYRGRFLPQAVGSQWAMVLDSYYHTKYISVCEEAVAILEELGRHWEIVELCRRAVVMDPYVEPLHVAFIKALMNMDAYTAAMDHYNHAIDLFMNELGVTPSEKLTGVYRELAKNKNALESDINVIRQSLSEGEGSGALYVEYELFKLMCQLKSRESLRTGQIVQLALVSAAPTGGADMDSRARNTFMNRLGEVVQASLRMGDLYTRYSVLQYLVLLQSASYENGQMVLDRIQSRFKVLYPRVKYSIKCTLLPLLPTAPQQEPPPN